MSFSATPPAYVDPQVANPYYSPVSSYGQLTGATGSNPTPWGSQLLELNPDAAFTRYGAMAGLPGDESPFARWFRTQFGRTQTGYAAAAATNPLLMYRDYLSGLGSFADWQRRFMQLTPQQRGEQQTAFAPAARWVNR